MSRGDPVEFTRRRLDGDQLQRAGNRIQKEAFEIIAAHVAQGGADMAVDVVLPQSPLNTHWRFDFIHVSFDGVPASTLTVVDGTTVYSMDLITPGPHVLPFETTRWATNAQVVAALTAPGAGVAGSIAILGARIERDLYS